MKELQLRKKNGTYVPPTFKENCLMWFSAIGLLLLAFLIRAGVFLFVCFVFYWLIFG